MTAETVLGVILACDAAVWVAAYLITRTERTWRLITANLAVIVMNTGILVGLTILRAVR